MTTFQGNGHGSKLHEVAAGTADAPGAVQPTLVYDAVAGSVAGQAVAVEDSLVGMVTAVDMTAHDTLILLGTIACLEGNARVLISTQAALALGAGLGLTLALLTRLARLKKRDR